MNTPKPNLLVNTFDILLALRKHVEEYPNDAGGRFAAFVAANLLNSTAQLFQDLLVLFLLAAKNNGFFVEFGAADGLSFSNTLILERDFGWKGILAEPARCWHSALKSNRRVEIDTRCVWSETGIELEFKETLLAELSTLSTYVDKDYNREGRAKGTIYPVETVSLNELLRSHNCPAEIDYLSIDTEGSELQILRAFAFDKYDIKVLTVEHNYCEPERQQLNELLTAKGFFRFFEAFSLFDDWYIKRSLLGN